MNTLDVLYQDEHYIAVHKPSGLFVHKSDFDRKADYALRLVRDMAGCYVWPVHRLDRPTSGVLVFALSKEATSMLSREFSNKRVEKTYLAIVRGYTDEKGIIDYSLRPEPDSPPQPSTTSFIRLNTCELPFPVGRYDTARYSLIKVTPKTGRKHQIRKHFAHIFHPVIGDSVHGDGKHNRLIRDMYGVRRLLLAATELSFRHPVTHVKTTITSPVEGQMQRLINEMFV